MFTFNKPGRNHGFLSWFGFIMAGAYLTLGFVVLFSSYFRNALTPFYQDALGILLIVYGSFRGWRIFKKLSSLNEMEDES